MHALFCLRSAPQTAWWILRFACLGSAVGASGHAQTTTPPGLPSYTFVDLGAALGQSVPALAGKDTAARGLNDSRAVVGDDGLYAMYGAAQGEWSRGVMRMDPDAI